MKKVMLILAVLAIAVPAMAETVAIKAEVVDDVNGIVQISYEVTGGENRVRALALNVTVTDGNIISVDDYFVGECNLTERGYGIFLGNIQIDIEGDVTDYGSPVAPGDAPSALGGINTDGVTLEMGSLYEDTNTPALSGTLCTVTVDTLPTTLCVTLEDTARGGIVMEDVTTPDVNLNEACVLVELEGCQCFGDVSGLTLGVPDGVVDISDLSYFVGYLTPYSPSYIAPVAPGYECLDLSGLTLGQQDGILDISDLSYMVGFLNPYSPSYIAPCMPAPAPQP